MQIDELVQIQQQIKAARSEAKREWEANDNALKADEERVEMAILKFLMDNNIKSVRTDFGTAFQMEDIIPTCSDWTAFYDWVRDHDAFDALEKRIKKTYVKEMMEMTGKIPDGVSIIRQNVVRVRKN
jgi:hypothetical protein